MRTGVVVALLLLGAVASCTEEDAPPVDTRTRVVFKHGKVTSRPDSIGRLIERFERANPDIDVVDQELPSNTDEQHRFYVINLEGESADFDVFALDIIWVSELSRAGWVRPIDHIVTEADRADFFPGTVEAVTYDGRMVAVPWLIGAGVLFYRKDLLDRYGFDPPATWAELIEMAKVITAREEGLHGFVWQGKQYEGLVCNALEYVWGRGGQLLKDGRAAIDSPENVEALTLMRDLVHTHHVTPELVMTLTEDPSFRIFQGGRAVFMRNWPYAWPLLQAEDSPLRGRVGVALLPAFEGHASHSTLGGWHLGINRFSKHPEEAARFIRFLAGAEAQKALALTDTYHPTRRSLYEDPELLAHDPFLARLRPIFERARPRPVTPYYMMISQVLQLELSAILANIRAPKDALASADRQIQHILEIEP